MENGSLTGLNMQVPKNMTYEEVVKQIQIVVDRISPRYTFGTYGVEDIKQEAFIICMEALDRYDQKRPLENFLAVHLSNRLKNFVRDNYYTKDEEEKKRVMKPKYLSPEDVIKYEVDYESNAEAKNVKQIIDTHLPVDKRADYLKLVNDVYISKKKRQELIQLIKDLVEEHSNEKG